MGLRAGPPSDSTEPPVASAAWGALGRAGVRGLVADSQAYGTRTRGGCLERGGGLSTCVPRPGAVRPEVETWGQQPGALPLLRETPGRTRQEPPRRWHGPSVVRCVPGEDAEGRRDGAERLTPLRRVRRVWSAKILLTSLYNTSPNCDNWQR
jgi:hypothetical protein